MDSSNLKKCSSLLIALFVLSAPAYAAPIFTPTGISLQSSVSRPNASDAASNTLYDGIGSYQANSNIELDEIRGPFTVNASTSAIFSASGLVVSGRTDSGRYFQQPNGFEASYGGGSSATISFTLTEISTMSFQWVGSGQFSDIGSTSSIQNTAGDIFLSCGLGGQCFDDLFTFGFGPNGTPNSLGNSGSFILDSGDYTLSLDAFGYQVGPGVFAGGSGTLSISGFTVVPVPAAVWLFGSGLIGLFGASGVKRLTSPT